MKARPLQATQVEQCEHSEVSEAFDHNSKQSVPKEKSRQSVSTAAVLWATPGHHGDQGPENDECEVSAQNQERLLQVDQGERGRESGILEVEIQGLLFREVVQVFDMQPGNLNF